MWIDSDRYKHENVLEELTRRLMLDLKNLRATGHDPVKSACQILKFEYPDVYPELQFADDSPEYHHPEAWEDKPNPREVWYGEAIYLDGKISDRFKDNWKSTTDYIPQIPGLLQMMVNFIKPGGVLPYHDDRGGWERIDTWTGDLQRGFTVSIGVDIPTEDPAICGLEFEGERRGCRTGEWVIFEGRNFYHNCWNFSNGWRIAAVVDIKASEFNLEGYEEKLNAVWTKEALLYVR